MKLKHRKLILIISMSALGIGLIVFSIAGKKEKQNEDQEAMAVTQAVTQEAVLETPTEQVEKTVSSTETPTETPEATEEPTVTATETPTPEVEVSALEQDAHPEVNKLIKGFLQAKIDGSAKKMKKLVTDPSYIDIESIQKKTEFIESYDNIKVYTKAGTGDIDYIAYVYMEVKIASIDTKAPGLNEFYIRKVGDNYKIVQGEISDETAQWISEARNTEDVQELLDQVNKKLKKAVDKDEELAAFCKKLDKPSDKKSDKASAKKSSKSKKKSDQK